MSYRGHVYDGQRRPLQGIAVSDGRNVCFTDVYGSFELPGYARTRLVFVCSLTRNHDDWYLHTKGHEGEYDFFIEPVDSKSDFCFLHTSDTELLGRGCENWIGFVRDQVKQHEPAFFVHTGDICYQEGLNKHYLEMNVQTTGCPVRYVIGNHDYVDGAYGEEMYEKLYGPAWYSFDCGDIHFVALAIGRGDRPSGYEQEDQWKWLLNDLARMDKSKRLIVLDHTCCRDLESFCQREGGITIDFKNAGLLAWAFGHYHANVIHEYDGIYHIGSSRPDSGGIDSSIGGLRKIALKGHELSSEFLYFTLPLQDTTQYLWRTKLPGRVFFATPIMVDGDVIVCTASDDYPSTCGVYRINGETGDIKWSFRTESAVKNDAALDENRVYVQDDKGWLYCIDVQSGECIWKTAAKMIGAGYTLTGPVVAEGTVFAGSMQLVQAFDKKDGSIRWIGEKSIQADCSPTRFVYDEARRQLIAGDQWVKLYAVDIQTGEILWENESDVRFRTSTPLLIGDKIYAVTYNSAVILSAQTGETLLQEKTGCSMEVSGAPAFENGILYYPTSSKGVLGLNAETLEVVKHFPAAPAAIFPVPYGHGKIQTVETTPQIVNGELVFAGLDGCVRFYNKESCEQNRCIHVGAPCLATPVIKAGFVITVDFEGNVTKFSTSEI